MPSCRSSYHFYPRPPRGGRQNTQTTASYTEIFLSTPSARRATPGRPGRHRAGADFYPRPPRGGRPCWAGSYSGWFPISIHALREEGDQPRPQSGRGKNYFYPRPPRGGRRPDRHPGCHDHCISIHALREEGDLRCAESAEAQTDFYPRPPRGGRRWRLENSASRTEISIHALREEGDGARSRAQGGRLISIHALREEGDFVGCPTGRSPRRFLSTPSARRATRSPWKSLTFPRYFYPRPPRGGRRGDISQRRVPLLFLSTPSARRATAARKGYARHLQISIHALREEGDRFTRRWTSISTNFYPRPPRGGRPMLAPTVKPVVIFLSTPSARRATRFAFAPLAWQSYFYPRPPRGGRRI